MRRAFWTITKTVFYRRNPYYDGALGDPVPVEKAFELGCDLVVLILTKPADRPRGQGHDAKLAKRIRKKYPKAAEQLCLRAQHYNESVAIAREYERQGKLIIISPDDTFGVDTLHKDLESLKKLYQKGYDDGRKILGFSDRRHTPLESLKKLYQKGYDDGRKIQEFLREKGLFAGADGEA